MEAAEREFVRRSHPIGIDLQVGRNPGVDDAVRSMGLIRIIERPGMALEVDALPEAPVPHGIEIRPVTSDEDVRGLVEVGVQAFDDDPEIGMSCYGVSSRGVDGARAFIAWRGEEPVGIAAGYLHEGAVGVMGVAVVPAARDARVWGRR